jgi:4'-phosphopantetheinyl transferase
MAVGRGRTVGVDVEYVDARKASVEVATRYFAPREVAALEAAPRELQDHLFFEYWTLKEAYIKARGMGLSLPLDKFSFHDSDGHVEIAIDPALEDDPMRWYFWQLRSTPQHLIALCVERISADAPRLGIRHCVPLLKVQECSLVALRASRNESSRTSAPRSAVSLMSNDYG